MASKQESKGKSEASAKENQKQENQHPKTTAAAEDSRAHKETASSKAIAADSASDAGDSEHISEKLSQVQQLLESNFSTIDPEAALTTIDEWHGLLNKAKEPELKALANPLKQLRQALKGGKATGHEIGEQLEQLGEQVSEFAAEADKSLQRPLQQLGKQLSKAGRSLGKTEDQEHIEQFESMTEMLDTDLTHVDTEQAIAVIDEWYALLHKSGDEQFKEIANHLKQLKQSLSKGKTDQISELLTQLGEQTVAAASEAHRGLKGPIQRFGKLLSKTGKSLEG